MTIGIDEVGRGSLAGPVVVAAVALPTNLQLARSLKIRGRLKDSKKLTPKQRLTYYQKIKNNPRIKFSLVEISPTVIDRINITRAANLAAHRAYKKLGCRGRVLLDGGLKLPTPIKHRAIIRGDQKYNEIKLASIIAKVHRDRIMERFHKKYPEYGFNEHQGYGTKKHTQALIEHGPSPIHRLTFLKFLC